ncbi:MAG: MATE family efflux transporter, partial [Oliverpabstia sp.]|nr:MATE family efflux transporter [Oliverpabstia sp.]
TNTTTFGLLQIAVGVTNAFTVVLSHQFGAKQEERMKKTVSNSLWITVVMSVLLGVGSFFGARPLMNLLGTPNDIVEQSVIYIQIYGGLIAGQLFYNAASAILKALGDSKTPLYFLIICSVLNVILDLIFVLVWKQGVQGVAWATVISQTISAVLCIVYMFKKYTILRFNRKEAAADKKIMGEILRIGIPLGLTNALLAVGMMVVTGVVNSFGSDIVAVYTVGGKVNQIAAVSFGQLAFSVAVFAGQNYGAERYDRIISGIKKALIMVVVLSVISSVAIFAGAKQVALLFLNADEVGILNDSAQMIRIVSCFYIFLGAIWVYNNALRGVGYVKATILSSIVELFAKVGLSICFAKIFGYVGIWYAEPIGWILGLIVSGVIFHRKKWMKSFV